MAQLCRERQNRQKPTGDTVKITNTAVVAVNVMVLKCVTEIPSVILIFLLLLLKYNQENRFCRWGKVQAPETSKG
jgi:hypothetical protein